MRRRARAALDALPDLARRGGATRPIRVASVEEIERELALALKIGVRFVALGEPEYPPALRQIDSAPPILALRGREEALQQPAIAIVGSRNASAAGLTFADRLARGLGQAGYVVVSGLARGIDQRAHVAALETGTIGVLAGGHAQALSARGGRRCLPRIAEYGAIVSEMPLEWEPRGRDFPRRNRLVSGLSLGTVVVEAARGSGSLITAKFAAEQNREVFAAPGSPLDPRAEGTNDLLRDGANLCARARGRARRRSTPCARAIPSRASRKPRARPASPCGASSRCSASIPRRRRARARATRSTRRRRGTFDAAATAIAGASRRCSAPRRFRSTISRAPPSSSVKIDPPGGSSSSIWRGRIE